ncbi:hypothetical protein IO90_17045 [Chryseobacterium sp. FH1]|nr:hypothetical protein IO90_17045 [Chryseobacterium sp. FH1]
MLNNRRIYLKIEKRFQTFETAFFCCCILIIWAPLSAFRSQSFLQTILVSIELEYTQKRISAQVGAQMQCNINICQSIQIKKTFQSFKL